MNDLELFKSIVRAVTGVPVSDIPKALAKVRALLAESEPVVEARRERKSRDRLYVGGIDRSGDDAA